MFLLVVMPACSSASSAALPVELAADQREQEQVVVGAARDDAVAALDERRRERARVRDDLRAVVAEARLLRLAGRRPPWRRSRASAGRPARPGRPRCRRPSRIRGRTGSCRRAGRAASCAWWCRSAAPCRPGSGDAPSRSGPRCARCRRTAARRPRRRSRGSARSRSRASTPWRRTGSASGGAARERAQPVVVDALVCPAARRTGTIL